LALLVLVQDVELGLVGEPGVELDVGLLVVQGVEEAGFEVLGLDEGAEDDRDVVEDEPDDVEEVVVVKDDEADEDEDVKTGDGDDETDQDDDDDDDETDDDELVGVLEGTLLEDEAAGQSVHR